MNSGVKTKTYFGRSGIGATNGIGVSSLGEAERLICQGCKRSRKVNTDFGAEEVEKYRTDQKNSPPPMCKSCQKNGKAKLFLGGWHARRKESLQIGRTAYGKIGAEGKVVQDEREAQFLKRKFSPRRPRP